MLCRAEGQACLHVVVHVQKVRVVCYGEVQIPLSRRSGLLACFTSCTKGQSRLSSKRSRYFVLRKGRTSCTDRWNCLLCSRFSFFESIFVLLFSLVISCL